MPPTFEQFETIDCCPVCESRDHFLSFLPDVCFCNNCLIYFRNPRPTLTEIINSYDSNKTYSQWVKEKSERERMWLRRLKLVQKYKKTGILMDIGTGDGHFLDVADRFGYTTFGTEVSKAASSGNHRVFNGSLCDVDRLPDNHFDIITMWHVLEHMQYPYMALKKAFNLLKDNGVLYIAVPNEENHLFRYRLGIVNSENPLGNLTYGTEIHLIHFQPKTLMGILHRAGFCIVEFGVDDVYLRRKPLSIAKLFIQRVLSSITGWHFSMAMYAVAMKGR